MAAPQQIDRRTFLANVRQSGLVSEEELARAETELPAGSSRGRTVARAFIEKGLLTKFQAERLLVGRTAGFLLGQYRVLDQIGRGGMGRVFKAEHRTMGRIVALKVLAPDLLRTDRAQEMFLREVRAAAQLVHPNIVTAYDANEIDGRYFLVLEFVDGPNLEQLVRRQGPLPVGQACDYVRQIAHGLQCAHLLGMVHRDVKPANILVQRRGVNGDEVGLVKISDFGLARLHNPNAADEFSNHPGTILTKDNTVMGTPDYLSPEQARNLHKTDIRSDLYSIGCTFYFLLTGQVLFPGGSTLDKLIRHGTEKAAIGARRAARGPRGSGGRPGPAALETPVGALPDAGRAGGGAGAVRGERADAVGAAAAAGRAVRGRPADGRRGGRLRRGLPGVRRAVRPGQHAVPGRRPDAADAGAGAAADQPRPRPDPPQVARPLVAVAGRDRPRPGADRRGRGAAAPGRRPCPDTVALRRVAGFIPAVWIA